MYQVTSTVGSRADAERAGRVFGAMADAWDAPGEESLTTAEPPFGHARRRTRKAAEPAPAAADGKPDPAALYGALTGQAPAETPKADPVVLPPVTQADIVPLASEPVQVEPVQPAEDTRTPDELLAAVRELAQVKGALWIRPVLTEYKAARLSDLQPDQLRQVLAAEAALS